MKKFKIRFKHLIEETYTATVEAESKSEALNIFDDDPFEYVTQEEPEDVQGLDIEIIETNTIL